jgi:heme exporter protein CcmD
VIAGGWSYVWAAYAVTMGGLAVLAVVVILRARRWAREARALDAGKRSAP